MELLKKLRQASRPLCENPLCKRRRVRNSRFCLCCGDSVLYKLEESGEWTKLPLNHYREVGSREVCKDTRGCG